MYVFKYPEKSVIKTLAYSSVRLLLPHFLPLFIVPSPIQGRESRNERGGVNVCRKCMVQSDGLGGLKFCHKNNCFAENRGVRPFRPLGFGAAITPYLCFPKFLLLSYISCFPGRFFPATDLLLFLPFLFSPLIIFLPLAKSAFLQPLSLFHSSQPFTLSGYFVPFVFSTIPIALSTTELVTSTFPSKFTKPISSSPPYLNSVITPIHIISFLVCRFDFPGFILLFFSFNYSPSLFFFPVSRFFLIFFGDAVFPSPLWRCNLWARECTESQRSGRKHH